MALHSAIEVFYPSTLVSSDGLYPWRYYVYAGAVVAPTLMAALAFVNPNSGYWFMGSYCMLPIRPFWYRLALMWIPRYIIMLLIIGLAIAIYTHVGFEFRRYSTASESMKVSFMDMADIAPSAMERKHDDERRASSMAHDILSSNHPTLIRPAMGEIIKPGNIPLQRPKRAVSLPGTTTQTSPRLSMARPPVLSDLSETVSPTYPLSFSDANEGQHESSITHDAPRQEPSMDAQIARQRRFIARQLRLLFIYPLAYTLMWLIPFVQHCTFYQDKWAQYPIYSLRVANMLCLTLMGFVDCVIFSMREKPWRSIDNSDGTFWGSLLFPSNFESENDYNTQRTSTTGRDTSISMHRTLAEGPVVKRFRGSVRASAGSDFGRNAASQARMRLVLEMEERKARLRRESTVTEVDVAESSGSGSTKPEGRLDHDA
jgi:G protein-coupled receptor GPR1